MWTTGYYQIATGSTPTYGQTVSILLANNLDMRDEDGGTVHQYSKRIDKNFCLQPKSVVSNSEAYSFIN